MFMYKKEKSNRNFQDAHCALEQDKDPTISAMIGHLAPDDWSPSWQFSQVFCFDNCPHSHSVQRHPWQRLHAIVVTDTKDTKNKP